MKEINPNTAARVWDRVRNTAVPTGDAPAILNLIEEELVDAAAYLRLARKLPPPQAAIARQLAQQRTASELRHALLVLKKAVDYTMSNVSPGAVCGYLAWALR